METCLLCSCLESLLCFADATWLLCTQAFLAFLLIICPADLGNRTKTAAAAVTAGGGGGDEVPRSEGGIGEAWVQL